MSANRRLSSLLASTPRPVAMLLARTHGPLFEDASDPATGRLRSALQFLWVLVRNFFRDRVQLHAASLAYSTLLAVVPALTLAFALTRTTGLYADFRAGTVDPFLSSTLGDEGGSEGVATLRTWAQAVLALVEDTDLSGLGLGGLGILGLALARVHLGVEEAFRQIFEERGPRPRAPARLRSLFLVATVTPLGLLYASASASFTHDTWLAALLAAWVPHASMRAALLFVAPPLAVLLGLLVLYAAVPPRPAPWRSRLLGAAAAALLWYGLQLAHVRLQIGLARWNALYSGFGAFPVLLASVHLSWVVVLFGAQLGRAHALGPVRAAAHEPEADGRAPTRAATG